MLNFLHPEVIENSMALFVRHVDEGLLGELNLRDAYLECLNRVQSHRFGFTRGKRECRLDFDAVSPENRATLRHFLDAPRPGAEHAIPRSEIRPIRSKVAEAYDRLVAYDRRTLDAVTLLVGCFLFARRGGFGGASVSDTLGVVWLSPPPDWTGLDFAESILHETTHQASFLDEMVSGVFAAHPKEMQQEEYLVMSSIRRIRRPYHFAFDAACVSIVLVDFFEKLKMSERATDLCRPLLATLWELRERANALSSHGRGRLEEMIETTRRSRSYQLLSNEYRSNQLDEASNPR